MLLREHDFRDLRPDWIRPVWRALMKLEHAVADWSADRLALPPWRSKVTPEFEGRAHLCRFFDIDGVERTFEWHARFTPGAGRLHFRLVSEDHTARVAYIGNKLGV